MPDASHATGRPVQPVVRVDVEIAASPERVFDALTDPPTRAHWLGGGDAVTGAPAHPGRADERACPPGAPSAPEAPEAGTRWDVPARAPVGWTARAVSGMIS